MTASQCTFIRLLADEEKGAALAGSIHALQRGKAAPAIFSIAPETFSMVPGSPFAYWVSERIRSLFRELPPFEGEGRTVKQGLATADDFRFVRAWWEVDPARIVSGTAETTPDDFMVQTCAGKKWVPFAKGGEYSPYYADVHLVVNWGNDGEEIKNYIDPETGKQYSRPQNADYYFRPGLFQTLRAANLAPHLTPLGCIFGHNGFQAFCENSQLMSYLALLNSEIVEIMYKMQLGRFGYSLYIAGTLQKTPVPILKENSLGSPTKEIWNSLVSLDIFAESSHKFIAPFCVRADFNSLAVAKLQWDEITSRVIQKSDMNQSKLNETIRDLYQINQEEIRPLVQEITKEIESEPDSQISSNNFNSAIIERDQRSLISYLPSYALGAVFGRWDIRYATGEKEPPELPDPFAPLPACSPGMLQGPDGLPLQPHEIPADYPLAVDPDGILVYDEGHPDDIIARIRNVLALIWGDRADAIEKETCEILGVKSLRDYFRKPSAGGFWEDHVKRYSKSRRKAPIYWLLQSAKKNYAIWIYYPRMDADTLYKALRYAKDKLAVEERRLEDLQNERERLGTGGPAVKRLEKGIDTQEAFISELHDFVERLEEAANLNLVPDHDDGVVLTIAPLRDLVPWKEPKNYWDELIDGNYEWSSIGKQLREKGLVKV